MSNLDSTVLLAALLALGVGVDHPPVPPGDAPPAPAAASPPAPGGGAPRALAVRVVDAYGGRGALERFPAMIQEGEVTSRMRGGKTGRLTRIYERPERLRVTIAYPGDGGTERRILDGARAWRESDEVTGTPGHRAQVLQAARLDLPWIILSQSRLDRIVDRGEVRRDGKVLRALGVPLREGLEVTAEIDPSSGIVVRTVARVGGPAGEVEFTTEYSDHRKVSGVLVPFREVNVVAGHRAGETVLARVEFLREAPTGAFEP